MPVQFVCPKCSQLLSVGSRKVGQPVDCPRCRQKVVVPTQEVAALGVALRESSRSPAAPPETAQFVVYDRVGPPGRDDPSPTDEAIPAPLPAKDPVPPVFDFPAANPPPIDVGKSADKQSRTAPAAALAPPVERPSKSAKSAPAARIIGDPRSGPLLLVSRPMVYVQAGLFAAVALIFLVAGYLIGRGVAPDPTGPEAVQAGEAVVLQGTLQFINNANQPSGDVRGVILALPSGKLPSPKLPGDGLRPGDADPAAGSPALLAIEALGGGYQRAAADGSFSLAVPQPGKYLVCFVSANAQRPAGIAPDEFQLALVKRYFDDAEGLIGRQKFAVKMEDLPGGATVRAYDFGQSGM
jgi:hypothetical protein